MQPWYSWEQEFIRWRMGERVKQNLRKVEKFIYTSIIAHGRINGEFAVDSKLLHDMKVASIYVENDQCLC